MTATTEDVELDVDLDKPLLCQTPLHGDDPPPAAWLLIGCHCGNRSLACQECKDAMENVTPMVRLSIELLARCRKCLCPIRLAEMRWIEL